MTEFVHLHVHSDFSLQDAAVSVHSLADRAEELGMQYLALTDHGNMFGAMEFLAACKERLTGDGKHEDRENPVRPIIGCEVYVAPGSRKDKKKAPKGEDDYFHLILLAANREGYFNLIKLCSFAYTEGFYFRPRIDEELLLRYHGGLICLSACLKGEIPRLIGKGRLQEAEKRARRLAEIFGLDEKGRANFYLELQDHGIPLQKQVNSGIVEIARKTGIPLVATNDIHYLNREDNVAHDVLLCIGEGKLRTDERRKRYQGDQFYFKTGDEMASLFPDYPEAISNTIRIAERCNADIPKPGPMFPEFEIPRGFENADEYLRHLSMEGLPKRYPLVSREILERMEYELGVIIKMGFTGYFLIVADFINWAKERDIDVGPGRGSGAGSIVAYSLRITDIDPLKYDLLFERFLNPERTSMPDFDVDFCNERRDEVIRYVTEKYGKERVGQIITFGTLGAKQVIKDVARVLNISISESESIAKLIPKEPKITLKKAFNPEGKEAKNPEIQAAARQLQELENDPRYTELFSLARKLEGLNRHSSIHAAGIVIGKTELTDYVPLYKETEKKGGGIATQYTMSFLEDRGLVKMDFLGLKTLDLIRHTVDLVRARGGEYAGFDITAINENDKKTFRMLGEGKSAGVFQFDREGMQNTLKKIKPTSIGDLTAITSLYRPGPMKFIDQFADSKNGRQTIEYPHPSLEALLKETYGVITYQEQVMMVARIIAGYSLGQADLLRRAMGKKKMEVMVAEKVKFIGGAREQGYSEEVADRIFELLIPFAEYGFNKSHAAAYSVLSYRTAYCKANFPAEFMAANLSNEIGAADKEKLPEYIEEARRMGLTIDPPDVNRSERLFSVSEGRIVYGLKAIKGIGDRPAEEIITCRKAEPYRDFIDFLNRVDIKTVGKKVIELLIETGAFDRMGKSRDILLANLEGAVEYVQSIKEDRKSGQSLFGEAGEKEYPDFIYKDTPVKSREEWLEREMALLGYYASGHPMDEQKDAWKYFSSLNLANLKASPKGSYTIVGILKSLREIRDRNGKEMAFGVLQDYRGEIDLVFFSSVWQECKARVVPDTIMAFKGNIDPEKDKNPEKPGFKVSSVVDIDKLARQAKRKAELDAQSAEDPVKEEAESAGEAKSLHIKLRNGAADREDSLYPLQELLSDAGSFPVFIHVPVSNGEIVIRTASRYGAGSGDAGRLKECVAVEEAEWVEE
ncbi:MAG: DNA polymerase III subunit alpha [Treponema sp.]|jgi:DNA polymerase-3 subunit alpha|nr:DNA polymerase III subunit alpha [Treponema sp.]